MQIKLFSSSQARHLIIVTLIFATSFLSGCTTALVAGAAIPIVDILHDRRSAGEYIDDSTIELSAKTYLNSSKRLRSSAHVNTVSWNGILLVTGEIDEEDLKQEIISELSSIKGVRQMVDETTIIGKSALLARTSDAWITSKVKSKLFYRTGLDANRIKVVTTRSTVYLMGIVTKEEAQQATEITQSVKGVARVVRVFEYEQDESEAA